MKSFGHFLLLFLKGMAMGAADVVPGVSGGTIAFISGIYHELLNSIKSVNISALQLLFKQGPKAFWQAINGNFLAVLFSGVLFSIATFANIVSYCLDHFPILIWSFFFGLVIASIIYILRQLPKIALAEAFAIVIGSAIALGISVLPAVSVADSYLIIFASGALAICAMILPGVSGSFILLLIGMYTIIIKAITEFDVAVLAVFMLGCVSGLLAFSRVLSWFLSHYYSQTMSLLCGFLVGSLAVIWPWKETLEFMIDRNGDEVVLSQRLLSPSDYGAITGIDPQLLPACLLMVTGLLLVLGLEYLGTRFKQHTA